MDAFDLVVLGSLNVDAAWRVLDFARPGETILAQNVTEAPGGKGLNQAVAAARQGARVALLGAVGVDPPGDALRRYLQAEGVDSGGVRRVADVATGRALIAVNAQGENTIMVAAGANAQAFVADFPKAPVALAQLETPLDATARLFQAVRAHHGLCLLNAAPVRDGAHTLLVHTDMLIVNEGEFAAFCGNTVDCSDDAAVLKAVERLLPHGQVIVTLGARGALAAGCGALLRISAPTVPVIDTTGAGDCFCGTLAAMLARGLLLPAAMRRAVDAAALAVGRAGAAPSFPTAAQCSVLDGSETFH